jgi:predicted RNase H-like HicB family nuclease
MNRDKFTIEIEREDDGRWIAEITDVPGAMAYGATWAEAINQAIQIANDADLYL